MRYLILTSCVLWGLLGWLPLVAQEPVDSTSFLFDGYYLATGEDVAKKIERNVHLVAKPSKSTCFAGEKLWVNYLVYTRLNLDARVSQLGDFKGFISNDIDLFNKANPPLRYARLQKKVYKVFTARSVELTPLSTGSFTISPVGISGNVFFLEAPSAPTYASLAQDFSKRKTMAVPLQISSQPVSITVKPLPEIPQLLKNKVLYDIGDYELAAQLSSPLAVSQLTDTLIVTLKGTGNWTETVLPEPSWPPGIVPLPVLVDDLLDTTQFPFSGIKRFKFPFIIQRPGQYQLPKLSLLFFSPNTRQYYLLQSEAASLKALPPIKTSRALPKATGSWFVLIMTLGALVIGCGLWFKNRLLAAFWNRVSTKQLPKAPSKDDNETMASKPVQQTHSAHCTEILKQLDVAEASAIIGLHLPAELQEQVLGFLSNRHSTDESYYALLFSIKSYQDTKG